MLLLFCIFTEQNFVYVKETKFTFLQVLSKSQKFSEQLSKGFDNSVQKLHSLATLKLVLLANNLAFTYFSVKNKLTHWQHCFTFAQHFKVKCDFGTQFFCVVLVAQGIYATGFKRAQRILYFIFKSANTLALCQSKAMLPK